MSPALMLLAAVVLLGGVALGVAAARAASEAALVAAELRRLRAARPLLVELRTERARTQALVRAMRAR